MKAILFLQSDLENFILLMIFLMIVLPVLLLLTGAVLYFRKKKKAGKIFLIIGGIWALICMGICGVGAI
ncbi:MAG: hypothetical protein AB3N14_20035 [Flavobacteriaceae bacterium]